MCQLAEGPGADADLDGGPVVLDLVRGVVDGERSAAGEIGTRPAQGVDHEHGLVGGASGLPNPVGVAAGEHGRRWSAEPRTSSAAASAFHPVKSV